MHVCELIEYWGFFVYTLRKQSRIECSCVASIRLNAKHTWKKMEWNSWHMLFFGCVLFFFLVPTLLPRLVTRCGVVGVFCSRSALSRVLAHFHHISNIFPLKKSTESRLPFFSFLQTLPKTSRTRFVLLYSLSLSLARAPSVRYAVVIHFPS